MHLVMPSSLLSMPLHPFKKMQNCRKYMCFHNTGSRHIIHLCKYSVIILSHFKHPPPILQTSISLAKVINLSSQVKTPAKTCTKTCVKPHVKPPMDAHAKTPAGAPVDDPADALADAPDI